MDDVGPGQVVAGAVGRGADDGSPGVIGRALRPGRLAAKLSAQVRVFATGNGRKTDPAGAHSVALAAVRSPNLVKAGVHSDLVALGLLAGRRDELGRARTQTINRIHRLLLELLPGGAKKDLSAAQARALIATTRPRDIAGRPAASSWPS